MSEKPLGPGPGAYGLPTGVGYNGHDIRKNRRPQYSFGIQTSPIGKKIGPGPGEYQIEGVTRYGSSKAHRYTMGARNKIREKSWGPGPGAHEVHTKPFFNSKTAPAYSMGCKNHYAFKNIGPGPNAYRFGVQTIKPGIPAYSIGVITKLIPKPRSPGPATYGRTNLDVKLKKTPAYSMTARNYYNFKSCTPGSNAYNLAQYKSGERFNYDNTNKLILRDSQCAGDRQSPIAIIYKEVFRLSEKPLSFNYYDVPLSSPLQIANNGHTVQVKISTTIDETYPSISGGILTDVYQAVGFHFHWGSPNSDGSEHTIDGTKYDVEMHIVHRNSKFATNEEAMSDPDGLVVLGILLNQSSTGTNSVGLKQVFQALPYIKEANYEWTLNGTFPLRSILGDVNTDRFFTYKGSLTTSPYSETVTWFVFPDIIPIQYEDLKKFWELKDHRGAPLLDNWRPIQNSKHRRVYYHNG